MNSNLQLIFSSSDPAGRNIAMKVIEASNGKLRPREISGDILYANFDDGSGPYIVLSRHSSEKRVKSLTCHFTGNWIGEAKHGGKPRELCIAMPSIMKGIASRIRGMIAGLDGYTFTLEVTHHGPTGNFPMMFVEIGSCREDWENSRAAEIVAEAVLKPEECLEGEVVMGVGGPHYAPDFTRLLEKYRIGHIIPQHAVDGLCLEMFRMGLERSTEEVEKVLIAWKGLSAPQREKIIGFCNECGIEHVKYK